MRCPKCRMTYPSPHPLRSFLRFGETIWITKKKKTEHTKQTNKKAENSTSLQFFLSRALFDVIYFSRNFFEVDCYASGERRAKVNALQSHMAWCSRQNFARDFVTTVFFVKLAFCMSCYVLVGQPYTHKVYSARTFIYCFYFSCRTLPLTSQTVHRPNIRRESPIN